MQKIKEKELKIKTKNKSVSKAILKEKRTVRAYKFYDELS